MSRKNRKKEEKKRAAEQSKKISQKKSTGSPLVPSYEQALSRFTNRNCPACDVPLKRGIGEDQSTIYTCWRCNVDWTVESVLALKDSIPEQANSEEVPLKV